MLCLSSLRVSRLPLHSLASDADEYCLFLWVTFDALDDPVNRAQHHLIIEKWGEAQKVTSLDFLSDNESTVGSEIDL